MEKEINSNAVSELDEASLEQVTGGKQNSNVLVAPGQAIGGGDAAEPNKIIVQGFQPLPPMLGAEN